ncbi:MAG: WD40 repeat domain-containing protein [Gemmataceae bacterium]|nr:WD40 repeat domain-containing protein [Gemmataceae bacterium]
MFVATNWIAAALLIGANDAPPPAGALACWSAHESGPVLALAFSEDARFVAAGCDDGSVRLWRWPDGKEERALNDHAGAVMAVAVAPDGKTVASAGADKLIRVWNIRSGKVERTLAGHQEPVEALLFAPDGKVLVSAGQDRLVIFWDPATGRELRRLDRHSRCVRGLALTRDGKTLVSVGEDRNIFVWDFPAGAARLGFKRPGWVHAAAFSADGLTLATGGRDQTVHVRNLRPPYPIDSMGGYEGPITSVAVFADGKMIAAGNEDGNVRLWEVMTQSMRRELGGHDGAVHAVALSPDQHRLLSGGADGRILVWDATGLQRRPGKSDALTAAEWQAAWLDLGGLPDKAFAAMGALRNEPKRFVPFLDERLAPIFQMSKRLTQLLPDLENDRFEVRRKAARELHEMGELAIPFLENALQGKELKLESRRRIEHAIMRAQPTAVGQHSVFAQLRRTIEVLEALGTPAAERRLRQLAKDTPHVRVRQDAQAALDRLKLPWHPSARRMP